MPDSPVLPVAAAPLITAEHVAGGTDWRIRQVICRAGPESPVVEERHEWMGVAVVASGTFTYRSDAGKTMLSPGALLLANAGACFECGHEHGTGDVCISFQYGPSLVEKAFAQFRAHQQRRFPRHAIPPVPTTIPFTARAMARGIARGGADELAARLLEAAIRSAHEGLREARPDVRDAGKVSALVREISGSPHEPWTLATLAARSGLDEFRLLRAFKRVAGVTPYQYVLRQRLEAAARMLLEGPEQVHEVSLSCGFNDLSEFNRRFRHHFGMAPMHFRRRYGARSPAHGRAAGR